MHNQTLVIRLKSWLKLPQVFIPLLLTVTTGLTYFATLWYGFMFDDLPTITNYFYIRYFDPMSLVLKGTRWVSRIVQQFIYHFWAQNPFYYRVINLVVFLLIGIVMFFVLLKLFSNLKKNEFLKKHALTLSALITGLFLLHPVQTQTATYIIQMQLEGLVVLLCFTTLLLFVSAASEQIAWVRNLLYGISFLSLFFAIGIKEISIVLPFLFLLVDWFFIAEGDWNNLKTRWLVHLMYFTITFGMFTYLGWTPKSITALATNPVINNRGNVLTPTHEQAITHGLYFISQFKILWHYIFIFFWPFAMCFDYDVKLSTSFWSADVIFPLLGLLALFIYALRLFLKDKINPFCFAYLWFFIAMLPRASFFVSTELICDYKTFLPSFGMMFFIGWGLMRLIVPLMESAKSELIRKQLVLSQVVAVCLVIFSCAIASKSRSKVWSSELAFWDDVIRKNPNKSRGYNNYAVALSVLGRGEEAATNFLKSIELDHHYAEPHINLASFYHLKRDYNKAFFHYQQALAIGEAHPELFHNLALLQTETGNIKAAETCFLQALRLRGHYSKTNYCLARLYRSQNRLPEALTYYEAALRGDGPTAEMCYEYGTLCCQLGQFDKAIDSLSQLKSDYRDVTTVLGICHYNKRNYSKACEYMAMAYQRDPKNGSLIYNYAMSLLNCSRYAEALVYFAQCNNPNVFPFVPLHVAKCHWQVGHKDKAKRELQELVKTTKFDFVKKDGVALMKEIGIC